VGQLYFSFKHGSLVSNKYIRIRVLVISFENERSTHTCGGGGITYYLFSSLFVEGHD
jgi:hypothetical protein